MFSRFYWVKNTNFLQLSQSCWAKIACQCSLVKDYETALRGNHATTDVILLALFVYHVFSIFVWESYLRCLPFQITLIQCTFWCIAHAHFCIAETRSAANLGGSCLHSRGTWRPGVPSLMRIDFIYWVNSQ